jgi:hypothetical protein
MLRQIVIEVETLGDSRTMFSLRIDANVISEDLTAEQARLVVGTILERIALPRPAKSTSSGGSGSNWRERSRGGPSSSFSSMWALRDRVERREGR